VTERLTPEQQQNRRCVSVPCSSPVVVNEASVLPSTVSAARGRGMTAPPLPWFPARYRPPMLLREEGDAVIAIGQASHAWISGQLARAWGNERFAGPEPREEVFLVAEQHDIGMAQWDLRPSLDPRTGRPHSFAEMPLAIHMALWAAAPAKLLSQSRYAALLVHGTAMYERRDPATLNAAERQLVHDYLDGQRALQSALVDQLEADRSQLARNQRLLWTWDSLSLALCLRWPPFALADVPGTTEPLDLTLSAMAADRFTLEPWPFAAERVQVRCEGRRLEGRFNAEAELHEALKRAPVVGLVFTFHAP
jgi:hypothetical protein